MGPRVLAEVGVQQAQLADVERHVLHPPVSWHHFAEQVQVVQDGQVLEKDGTEIAGFEGYMYMSSISNLREQYSEPIMFHNVLKEYSVQFNMYLPTLKPKKKGQMGGKSVKIET